MLSAVGVPPDVSIYLTSVTQYVKYMAGFLITLYLVRLQYERHVQRSAGAQYRRHLKDGGYIHC